MGGDGIWYGDTELRDGVGGSIDGSTLLTKSSKSCAMLFAAYRQRDRSCKSLSVSIVTLNHV